LDCCDPLTVEIDGKRSESERSRRFLDIMKRNGALEGWLIVLTDKTWDFELGFESWASLEKDGRVIHCLEI
jgi:hypothetical protein